MPRYKRTFEEAELDISFEDEVPPEQAATLAKLRNMWEFASLMQYIFLFGHVVKIDDDFDIEDLEAECLKPQPAERLAQIGLALLKYVSSHRGLTPEIFDEYTRRQYTAKAPHRNPFGEDEEPAKFDDFDVFTKVRVLQQLSTWTLGNAERIRGMMAPDEDHLNWRMEPLGWDKDDRAYFVLDDNRMYRRTDEPPPPPSPKIKAKAKTKSKVPKKSKSRGTRSSKRRKIEESEAEDVEEVDADAGAEDDTVMTNGEAAEEVEEPGFGFTNKTWECVAITLDEYHDFLGTIFRSRDANEKQLRRRIEEDVLPIIERRAEALRQKQLKKMRELENLQKLAVAKRSSRIADKTEREKHEREIREAEEKKQAELQMAHEEQERQRRIEEGHESRRLTREQRLKEREVKRILHEEELAKIEEQATRASSQDPASDSAANAIKRMSERQMKTQREQHQSELEKLASEEDKWIFDCSVCGLHGENLDDGTHSIACERCSVWQHSKCHGFSPKQAEKDGFHFVCGPCKRREEEAKRPKIPPLKLGKNKFSASPESPRTDPRRAASSNRLPDHLARQLDHVAVYPPPPDHSVHPFGPMLNGPSLSPHGQAQGPPGYRYPPVGNFAPHHPQPQQPWQGSPLPPPGGPSPPGYGTSPLHPMANGYGHPGYQHQQQHHFTHRNAVSSAGAHLAYQAPYQPPSYAYTPRGSPGVHPIAPSPPSPPQQQQQQQHHQRPPYHQYPSHSQPPYAYHSPPVMNGMPARQGQQSSASPPQRQQSPYGQSPAPLQQLQPRLSQTPSTNLPPPATTYAQHVNQSPVKSASPPQHNQQPQQRSTQPSPRLAQTPQAPHAQMLRQAHPSPAGSNANGIAADGMSGPWPQSSTAIPQKHDQSPAPPSSGHIVGETKVLPPAAPLVPSPNQQMQAAPSGPQTVPVKKVPEFNPSPLPSAQQQLARAPEMTPANKKPEMNGFHIRHVFPFTDPTIESHDDSAQTSQNGHQSTFPTQQ